MRQPIPGFPGYEVSDDGRVFAPDRELKVPTVSGRQYPAVYLKRGGGASLRRYVHILVLESFIGPRPENQFAAHWDGNKSNAALSNLRWATSKENEADNLRNGTRVKGEATITAKLTEQDVVSILRALDAGEAQGMIAARFGVSHRAINKINRGISWSHIPRTIPVRGYSAHKCTVGKPMRWSLVCIECGRLMPIPERPRSKTQRSPSLPMLVPFVARAMIPRLFLTAAIGFCLGTQRL